MHYIERSYIPAPACLSDYRHGRDNWETVSSNHKQDIRTSLERMQGRRCAYCECSIDEHTQHIEHFRQRSRYPQGTFDWNNLFWSCVRGNSCGKHKDGCGVYDHNDLIKPDVEDPERFLLFIKDGSIVLRQGLTAEEQRRARETLRVFNLDAQWGPLRNMRKVAAIGYINTAEAIRDFASTYQPEHWMPFLEQELELIRDLPFCTAIKHVLTPQGAVL